MKKSVSKNESLNSIDELISSLKKISQYDHPNNSKKISLSERLKDFGVSSIISIQSDSFVRTNQAISTIELLINQDCIKKNHKTLTKSKYQGESLSNEKKLSELILKLNSKDFFSTSNLIIISEPGKLKDKSIELILNTAKKSEDSIVLIIFKTLPINKIWKEFFKEYPPFAIKKLGLESLCKWTERQAKQKGLGGISKDACEFLAKELEESVDSIDQALNKLALSCKIDEFVELDSIKKLYSAGIHKDSFSLFQSISKKDFLLTELILDELIDSGMHPLQITGFLSKCIRAISCAKTKIPNLSPDLSNQWFLRNLPISSFSESRLKSAISILAEIDNDIKGKNYGEEQVLKSKIFHI